MAGPLETNVTSRGAIYPGTTGNIVRVAQTALLASGSRLDLDGDYGPITEEAVKRFQSAHDMPPVGFIGLHTAPLLDALADTVPDIPPPAPSVLNDAPWLSYMRAITGTKEVPGDADSPIVLSWAGDIAKAFPDETAYAKQYTHDAIPWCGLTMRWVMARAGIKGPWGPDDTDRWLYAKSWSTSWHGATKLARPIPGAVCVFTRSGGGHVTLCEKYDGSTLWGRGGNQSDMVNVSTRSMDGFLGAYWPPGRSQAQVAGDTSNAVAQGSEA